MKRLLLVLFVLFAGTANATNYYVSATGNDASSGTSPDAAWKTTTKVNSFSFAANDSILFKRGDFFYGSIIVKRNNLNISAYGTGAKPVISGFTTIGNWTSLGDGIYECSVNAKSNLNMVAINGRPQQIGRYPNASDANGGYLMYQTSTTYSITDNTLSSAVNWTGAEVAIKKNPWTVERDIVTSQAAGTVSFRYRKNYNSGVQRIPAVANANQGYFFMNDRRTLDQFGEWYFDTSAKKLLVYFGNKVPGDYSVKVSTIDTLLDMGLRTYVSVNNLSFEGANMSAVYSMNGGFIKIQNCDMTNIGGKAIQIFNTGDVLIDGVNTKNVLCNAIEVADGNKTNVTVRNCAVRNTAPFIGMGSWYEGSDNKAMVVTVSSNMLVEYNVVDSAGLAGIAFYGNDVVVQYNVVSNFCYTLHDNGGIYTWVEGTDANPGKYYTNRIVRNNIVYNGIGAPLGNHSSGLLVGGIFLDGRSMNVLVEGNTIFNVDRWGIHCNNPAGVTIRGNTLYNNKRDLSFMRWAYGSITNLNVKKNISFALRPDQHNLYYTNAGLNTPVTNTISNNLRSLGSIDSNYYQHANDAGIALEIYSTEGGAIVPTSAYSLEGWKAATSFDLNTKKPAQKLQPYTLNNTIGNNLFSNSQFASNINGLTLYSSNATAAWDNTSKIAGTGSLKVNFAAPNPGRFCILHSPIGAVSNAKKYILRFTTLGTSANGIVRAYLRKSGSPYNDLVATQSKSFGIAKMTHEFLFNAPSAEAAASFVISIEEGSGTTYVDNIEFYEANATINTVESQVRFEYNPTKTAKQITLDAKYIGIDSTVYNGTITLQPFSSKIMIKAGPVDSLPVADAGIDKVISLPVDSVVLTGSGRGGTITNYTWTKISGPAQFTISNVSNGKITLKDLVAGTYRFQLRVTNNAGLSAMDTVNIIASSVLPVTLLDFTGRNNNDKIRLQWETTGEINSSAYIVQRSADGRQFQNLGRVLSNNDPNAKSRYSFTDSRPLKGANYYRLVMTDRDGTVTYSRTILLNIESNIIFSVNNLSLNGESLKVIVNSDQQQSMNLRVVDVAGRIVASKQMQLQHGVNTLVTDIPATNRGVYYVQLFTANDAITKTVLSQ